MKDSAFILVAKKLHCYFPKEEGMLIDSIL